MEAVTENRSNLDPKERIISKHLHMIDPSLTIYSARLAKPPYKDLATPYDEFAQGRKRIEPTDLVTVHLTDTFPQDGIIHPAAFYRPEIFRYTVHTSINCLAPEIPIWGYEWKANKYAILMPFEKVIERVLAFNPADTFFLEDLELPVGTVVLKARGEPLNGRSAGKAQVVDADYSKPGEKITGFQLAVYRHIIEMGYFPQEVSPVGEWLSWGFYMPNSYTEIRGIDVWREFCKRNGLEFAGGLGPHYSHWTSGLEEAQEAFKYYQREKDYQGLKQVLEEADNYLDRTDIPDKYKLLFKRLLVKYRETVAENEENEGDQPH